jgi:hypothetical protein
MFIAALLTIAKLRKQPRHPAADEWIKKMWYLYTMEFYSAMKKNKILSFAHKWMERGNIIWSKVSQAQKIKNPSYADFRSRAKIGVGLYFCHITR